MSVNIFQNNALKKIAGNYAIDSSLSTTSDNAVQNKVITSAINDINSKVGTGTLDVGSDCVSGINTLNTHLSANRLNAEVDISPYVEGVSAYTCPSDGYFHVSANGVGTYANGYVNHFNSMLVYGTSEGAFTKTTMFVKKGMLLSCAIGTSGYAIFRPIIN